MTKYNVQLKNELGQHPFLRPRSNINDLGMNSSQPQDDQKIIMVTGLSDHNLTHLNKTTKT